MLRTSLSNFNCALLFLKYQLTALFEITKNITFFFRLTKFRKILSNSILSTFIKYLNLEHATSVFRIDNNAIIITNVTILMCIFTSLRQLI